MSASRPRSPSARGPAARAADVQCNSRRRLTLFEAWRLERSNGLSTRHQASQTGRNGLHPPGASGAGAAECGSRRLASDLRWSGSEGPLHIGDRLMRPGPPLDLHSPYCMLAAETYPVSLHSGLSGEMHASPIGTRASRSQADAPRTRVPGASFETQTRPLDDPFLEMAGALAQRRRERPMSPYAVP